MSQPIRSSVRTSGRTPRTGPAPVLAEAIEGRRMFAGGPHPHGFGPPTGHWGGRAEMTLVLPLTAVALFRAAAAATAEAETSVAPTSIVSAQTMRATEAVRAAGERSAADQAAGRAVPVTAVAAKPAEVAVTHADLEAVLQTTAAPATNATSAASPGEPAGLTFGPFNVATAMAAPVTVEPKLTWVASGESSVLRPDVTPAAARRVVNGAKTADAVPADLIVAGPIETQQAALGLPSDAMAERPMWQRLSAAIAGATLVAVNSIVRRRRQLAANAPR